MFESDQDSDKEDDISEPTKAVDVCLGLFGDWFGHNYQPLLVREALPEGLSRVRAESLDYIDAIKTKEYKIVCTRCGKERKES